MRMDIEPLEILKWIGIVLAAGFVGYFGRYLAMMILRQTRKKESSPPPDAKVATPDEAQLKIEKKRAKQAVKQTKKSAKQ